MPSNYNPFRDYSDAYHMGSVQLNKLNTVNQMAKMKHYERVKISKNMRGMFAYAWRQGEGEKPLTCAKLVVHSYIHQYHRMPDTDSIAYCLKRILDGGVDAGIILEDSPRVIREIHIISPRTTFLEPPYNIKIGATIIGTKLADPIDIDSDSDSDNEDRKNT